MAINVDEFVRKYRIEPVKEARKKTIIDCETARGIRFVYINKDVYLKGRKQFNAR